VTLIDRRNHHLFQPLLYQVATGALSPANIAVPLRALLKKQKNAAVRLGEVRSLDLEKRQIQVDGQNLDYDSLIVATGASQSYFGHRDWERVAPGLKSLEDATRIRRDVLLAFEKAENEDDPQKVKDLLTFVVVGAGPTGVELAGALAEVAKKTLRQEFRRIDPTKARVVLVEGADRVLPPFAPNLSEKARCDLEMLGVEVRLATKVVEITPGALLLETPSGQERIAAANILWAAGVEASPLGRQIAEQGGASVDRAGRVVVGPDCSLPGRPEVFVIGDLASYQDGTGKLLPGLAPVATQQGRYVARLLHDRLRGRATTKRFNYVDKGSMAVIGRRLAVAQIGKFGLKGGLAWLAWLFIHLMYLTEFENRILVLTQWGWNYVTRNRAARLITHLNEP
jgi:NADH:ubiquinone reductase (H+-translocating)